MLPFNKSWPHLNWNLGYEGARTHAATQSGRVQGGERNGWGSSPGVSLDIMHWGGCRWWRKSLWRSGGGGRYEAADQGSATFRNIQAASLPRWGQLEVLASRPHGREHAARGRIGGPAPHPFGDEILFRFGADYTDCPNLRLSTLELFQNPTAVPCRSY